MTLSGIAIEQRILPVLELLKENDPRLNEVSAPWDFEVDGDPAELVKDMLAVLAATGGVGLAAPQCGVLKRIFVMGVPKSYTACINPALISLSEERALDLEGCLSFPDLWMKIKRPTAATVKYQTVTGEEVEENLIGLRARIFLHEYDHLVGITFDHRAGDLALKMARDKRKKTATRLSRV
jgi:peptide deformylase